MPRPVRHGQRHHSHRKVGLDDSQPALPDRQRHHLYAEVGLDYGQLALPQGNGRDHRGESQLYSDSGILAGVRWIDRPYERLSLEAATHLINVRGRGDTDTYEIIADVELGGRVRFYQGRRLDLSLFGGGLAAAGAEFGYDYSAPQFMSRNGGVVRGVIDLKDHSRIPVAYFGLGALGGGSVINSDGVTFLGGFWSVMGTFGLRFY